jgi:hypothetical protein
MSLIRNLSNTDLLHSYSRTKQFCQIYKTPTPNIIGKFCKYQPKRHFCDIVGTSGKNQDSSEGSPQHCSTGLNHTNRSQQK